MGQLAELVKESRARVRVTQDILAAQLGYSSSQFISNVERGMCSFPLAKVNKLARLLKISPDAIIEAKLADTKERYRREAKNGRSKTRVSGTGL